MVPPIQDRVRGRAGIVPFEVSLPTARPPMVWFFYDNRRDLLCSRLILNDGQVQSADFYDIASPMAEAISGRLRLTESITPNLTFWKLKEPQQHLSLLPVDVALQDIAEELHPSTLLAPYVSRGTEPVQLAVHWLKTERKRALEEAEEDVVGFVKKIKLEAPSLMAQASNFRKNREEQGALFVDHRHAPGAELPNWVKDLPPISLQYRGFGHFLDIFRGRKDVPGLDKISSPDIRSAVDDFAQQMSTVYADQYTWMGHGFHQLNNIFSARTDNLSLYLSEGRVSSNDISNDYILGQHGAAICVAKFRNEPTGNAIPYVEMMGNFIRSTRNSLQHDEPVMRGWNIPCLGLTIIGHYVTFYAMIHLKEWRVVALTPGLSCILDSGEGDDRNALYNAFTAASVLLACIQEEAEQLVASPRPPIQGKRYVPYVSTLRHPSGSSIDFKLRAKLPFDMPNRHVYAAKMNDGTFIIVKFTRRYSYELHRFCADRGLAPKLLGFERLPGGFFGVAMEYFRSPRYITDHLSDRAKVVAWGEQLRELVADFHAEGLVHGDLRSANILCNGDKVMLIDFDWAGREGETCFPHDSLNDELTDGREDRGLKITKADDQRVLCNTLKRVGCNAIAAECREDTVAIRH